MKTTLNELEINGVVYVPKGTEMRPAQSLDGMKYVIARTYSAGVFAGYLAHREGKEATLKNARRLWYWSGASSLSQLAMEGVKNPNDCKFPCEVSLVDLTEVIEVLDVTEEARICIANVPVWQQ
ncbi:hypothetical protein COW46_00740 [Candidatus Gracilibacteria bacterium CG17_big_fil_post_rev_8_21_14_2_50_48_13]|nr:MAG: hypothetical protein COW46_00740 [Candidatus Gracilibacteria bacterium CG17_big_fil_post_rev_8_21_14_2_50_48_13]